MSRAHEQTLWVNERLAALGLDPIEPPPRPKRAVVGIDGDKSAEHAALWAAHIADKVHLVTVLPELSAFRTKPQTHRSHQKQIADLKNLVQGSRSRIRKKLPNAKLKEHTLKGSPSTSLSDACKETRAHLLAVGARNPRTSTAPFGSVAETLMHHGSRPTLAARNPPNDAPIIAGIGNDRGTRFAAAWATALATWLERPLRLVHSSLDAPAAASFEATAPQAEAKIAEWPPRFGFGQEFEGNPGALLVLGQAGERAWMGSTAVALARSASCSVFIARNWQASNENA